MREMQRITLGLVTAAILVAFVATIGVPWLAERGDYAFPDGDLPRHLTGDWDWASHEERCGKNAEHIEFSANQKTMLLIFAPSDTARTLDTAVYDVSQLSASRLRGAIRGEKRQTDAGRPVGWDLIMSGPDEFRWHRTDWALWARTPSLTRCPTARP